MMWDVFWVSYTGMHRVWPARLKPMLYGLYNTRSNPARLYFIWINTAELIESGNFKGSGYSCKI